MQAEVIRAWRQAELQARGGPDAARAAYRALLPFSELAMPARLRLAAIEAGAGALRAATAQAMAAAALPEPDPQLRLQRGRLLFDLGEVEAGLTSLGAAPVAESDDAMVQLQAGAMLCDLSFYDQALERLERARALGMAGARLSYLLGLSRTYCGLQEEAREAFEDCLRADPDFAPAARLLSSLRRQQPGDNHVDALRAALSRLPRAHVFAPLLHYALFKELDDLDDPAAAWPHLEQGMDLRRAQLAYDETADVALFESLVRWQPASSGSPTGREGEGPRPLFVVGMPRSGSTLLERLLSAHPDVTDAGELRDFVCQLRWSADQLGGPHPDARLVGAMAGMDLGAVGRRYLDHTAWRAQRRACFTDKLPIHFLLAGPIAAALPQARIVHIARAPMDSCFSNLKALFANAYPHSYVQEEMARHYLRYRQLMAHWDRLFPGRVLHVRYESLVTVPETEARRILAFCGLPWTDAVLDARTRTGMVGTASTSQVREPMHTRYLGQWRRYAGQLARLEQQLAALDTE